MRILVTGMSGLIGTALRRAIDSEQDLTALNRGMVDGVSTHCADISDFDAIKLAFQDQDVVVHLAAKAGENYTW
ncbi:MAG: NAD-dependent epimerase/dehydratase family protein, partial [Gammaproteobacteria bacterium]|nr:NAD-dependent epimerase/dehydratase family protein [Gammaproteobacteria bacterium]